MATQTEVRQPRRNENEIRPYDADDEIGRQREIAQEGLRRMSLEELDPRRNDGRNELARLGLISEAFIAEANPRSKKPPGRA